MKEEFNLSEEREKLKKDFVGKFMTDMMFEMILAQDKEFIRLLKEEIKSMCTNLEVDNKYILRDIDKLAGEKLI